MCNVHSLKCDYLGILTAKSSKLSLALLDSVSRGHGMGIFAVVRPSVRGAIFSEPNARIAFKFWLLLPLGHTLRCFFLKNNFFLIFYEYFSFLLTWDPMGAKNFKTLLNPTNRS